MIRGTTPTLNFTLPFKVDTIKTLWITFSQRQKEIFTLTDKDCVMSESTVSVTLTQEDTLQFDNTMMVEIQLRVLSYNDTALASKIINVPVQRVLKGDVI